jgi:hypothetical protein
MFVCLHIYLFILVSSFNISCEYPQKKLTLINNILEEKKTQTIKMLQKAIAKLCNKK